MNIKKSLKFFLVYLYASFIFLITLITMIVIKRNQIHGWNIIFTIILLLVVNFSFFLLLCFTLANNFRGRVNKTLIFTILPAIFTLNSSEYKSFGNQKHNIFTQSKRSTLAPLGLLYLYLAITIASIVLNSTKQVWGDWSNILEFITFLLILPPFSLYRLFSIYKDKKNRFLISSVFCSILIIRSEEFRNLETLRNYSVKQTL